MVQERFKANVQARARPGERLFPIYNKRNCPLFKQRTRQLEQGADLISYSEVESLLCPSLAADSETLWPHCGLLSRQKTGLGMGAALHAPPINGGKPTATMHTCSEFGNADGCEPPGFAYA